MEEKVAFVQMRVFDKDGKFGWEVCASNKDERAYYIRAVSKAVKVKRRDSGEAYPIWIELAGREGGLIYRSEVKDILFKRDDAGSRCYGYADKLLTRMIADGMTGRSDLENNVIKVF